MSNNYDDYKPLNPMPPRKRKNSALNFVKYSIVFLLILALAISAAFFITSYKNDRDGGSDNMGYMPSETTSPDNTGKEDGTEDVPDITEDVPTANEPENSGINLDDCAVFEVNKEGINKGSLIFVSENYKAVYPSDEELVKISDNKSAGYGLSSNTMLIHKDIMDIMDKMLTDFVTATGHNDLVIQTSYRTEERQKEVYDRNVANLGEEKANATTAKPGASDHHTGYTIALKVIRDGKTYTLNELEGYDWILENCHKYGFIERYPESKVDKTNISYTSALCLRYVGFPHAEIIKKNNLCLEEYITSVKDYAFGRAHYKYTTEEGTSYEIYYVNGEVEGKTVKVSVPKNKEYTISGNNMDGFIVTVKNN